MSGDLSRRTALCFLGLPLAVGLGGCLRGGDRSSPTEREPTASTTRTSKRSTRTPEPTTADERTETFVPEWEDPDPEKDHDVYVENDHDRTWGIEIRITHGESVVFEESFDAESGFDRTVYNFLDSPIDGIASYEVRATLEDGTTDTTMFTTDSCHGNVVIVIDERGELAVFYSVC